MSIIEASGRAEANGSKHKRCFGQAFNFVYNSFCHEFNCITLNAMPNLSIAQAIDTNFWGKTQNFKIPGFKKETVQMAHVYYRGLG